MRCRIVVFGSTACGKSSIVHRFLANDILSNYDPTIEDFYQTSYFLGHEMLKIHLTDTAGKEFFKGMRLRYIKNSEGFLVVYSVKNRDSFTEAIKICHSLGPVPKILVATKADVDTRYREVSPFEGRFFAQKMNCSFAETSSVTGDNNQEIFHEIFAQIRDYKEWKKSQKRSLCCIM